MLGGVTALPYSFSKATEVGVVRLVADDLAHADVRMNAISPHDIVTPLLVRSLARVNPGVGDETLKRMVERGMRKLQGAVLEPEDVARLQSRRLPRVRRGQVRHWPWHNLVVDGGFTVGKPINVRPRSIGVQQGTTPRALAPADGSFVDGLHGIDGDVVQVVRVQGLEDDRGRDGGVQGWEGDVCGDSGGGRNKATHVPATPPPASEVLQHGQPPCVDQEI
jgi:hypothetical protein